MYPLSSNASRDSIRVLTGIEPRSVAQYPSGRHGFALAEAAVGGTRVQSAAGRREAPK